MPEKLLESDFIMVDFSSMFNNKQNGNTASTDEKSNDSVSTDQSTDENNNQKIITDWGKELEDRLAANKKMSPEAREKGYIIEDKFFKEYFYANWDADCAKQLVLMGESLRKALKVLGFSAKTNPILGFIKLPYVQKNLILPKLLNSNTFKAIYEAVAAKLVADSEFLRASDYNIIYCPALYKKPVKEIIEYLKKQKQVLKLNLPKYTIDIQNANKKAFFVISKIKELDPKKRAEKLKNLDKKIKLPSAKSTSTELNSLEEVAAIIDPFGHSNSGHGGGSHKSHMSSKALQNIADKVSTISDVLALVQYLSMTTGSNKAIEALNNEKLSNVPQDALVKAYTRIQSFKPKGELQASDADALVGMLLSKL